MSYKHEIAGLKKKLPIFSVSVNDKPDIAAFVMLSDVELTIASAEKHPVFIKQS